MLAIYLCIVLICLFFIWLVQSIRRPTNFPPGPIWLPIIGNTHYIYKLSASLGGQYLAFQHISKDYNSDIIGLRLSGNFVVYIRNYQLVQHVLTSEEYEGRPDNFFFRLRCMGKRRGITFADGPIWQQQRRLVMKHLKSSGYGRKAMEDLISKEVHVILNILKNTNDDFQLGPIFTPSVLNVLWTIATSSGITREDSRLQYFMQMMRKRVQAFHIANNTMSLLPWLRFIIPETIGYNMIVRFNDELKKFLLEVIHYHYETWYPNRQDDLIYCYITEMNKNEKSSEIYNDDQLIIVCLDLFFGGITTTTNALDFLFLEMLLNPDIQDKAAECINVAIPSDKPITYADRFKVPYVEAIIAESIRLHAVTPIIGPRRVLKDTILNGYHIPKNATVIIDINSVHIDPDFWEKPNLFCPERFISKEGKLLPEEHVLNYGLGKRRCFGEQLARQCIFLFFSSIIRKFKICPVPNTPLPTTVPVSGLALSTQKYLVRIVPRNPTESV